MQFLSPLDRNNEQVRGSDGRGDGSKLRNKKKRPSPSPLYPSIASCCAVGTERWRRRRRKRRRWRPLIFVVEEEGREGGGEEVVEAVAAVGLAVAERY